MIYCGEGEVGELFFQHSIRYMERRKGATGSYVQLVTDGITHPSTDKRRESRGEIC